MATRTTEPVQMSVRRVAGVIEEATVTYRVVNITSGGAAGAMSEAIATAPGVNSALTIDGDVVRLEETVARHERADDTTAMLLECTYRRQDTPSEPRVRVGTRLRQIVTEVDKNGATITVTHQGVEQGGDVTVDQIESYIEFETVESTNVPGAISQAWANYVNDTLWQAGEPGTWKCEEVVAEAVDEASATKKYRMRYLFVYNPDGWTPTAYYVDPISRRPPPNLNTTVGNGVAEVDWYEERDFGAKFPSV